MSSDTLLDAFLAEWDDSRYPEAFLKEYTLMACLSERGGIDTFLAQNRAGEKVVAKCFDKAQWAHADGSDLLDALADAGLPRHIATYENERVAVVVREYIEGEPLHLYAREHALSEQEIVRICVRLCDILAVLHHRSEPIIHRDIKPQNVIVRPDGDVALIDFDIARVYRRGGDTDTMFMGTPAYAPPEQYGFSQTDARTDIYSLGILLRWLLTGSTRKNDNVRVYRPLAVVVKKCTGFSPKERFADVAQVRRALLAANPRSQALIWARRIACGALAAGLLAFGGVKLYRKITYTPFTADAIPAYRSDEERIADAVKFLKDRYGTDMFDDTQAYATFGDIRRAMIELYGLDADYVNAINTGEIEESDAFFLPWPVDNAQNVPRNVMAYAAVKVHDPAIVADWSSLKDDNGYYPGVRVAEAFAEKTGILTGVNRPGDLSLGEMALTLANADRVFDAAEK